MNYKLLLTMQQLKEESQSPNGLKPRPMASPWILVGTDQC